MIGRAEQVDVAHGLSSTSACQLCCPASFFDGACNPSSAVGVPGDTTQFTATQRKQDCNGNILAPVVVASPNWSSTNTAVATVNTTGLATAQSPGTGNIQASWEIFYSNPDSGCACRDTCSPTARCCVSSSDTFIAEALCDVSDNAVTFKTARIGGTTANFDFLRRAVINLPAGAFADGICHNFVNFTCVVSFNLPDDAVALSSSRSSIRCVAGGADRECDWFINVGNFQNINLSVIPKSGEMAISMHRRTTSGPNVAPSINVTVAGDYPAGTFSTVGVVYINCP